MRRRDEAKTQVNPFKKMHLAAAWNFQRRVSSSHSLTWTRALGDQQQSVSAEPGPPLGCMGEGQLSLAESVEMKRLVRQITFNVQFDIVIIVKHLCDRNPSRCMYICIRSYINYCLWLIKQIQYICKYA